MNGNSGLRFFPILYTFGTFPKKHRDTLCFRYFSKKSIAILYASDTFPKKYCDTLYFRYFYRKYRVSRYFKIPVSQILRQYRYCGSAQLWDIVKLYKIQDNRNCIIQLFPRFLEAPSQLFHWLISGCITSKHTFYYN